MIVNIGDKLKLTADIYDDDGEGHSPPGYIALKGETVIVRDIRHGGKGGQRVYVSHPHITDNAFLVYDNEVTDHGDDAKAAECRKLTEP